jgi:2-methoxy-6-polyprenyl-1,4-benzoquinol methylase
MRHRIAAAFGSRRWLCSASPSSDGPSRRAATRATEFGFRTVPEQDKERLVGHVFHSVASKYDIMNDLMSAGLHRVWKSTMVEMIGLRGMGRSDLQVLDVAGGTGDVAFRIADQMGSLGQAAVSSRTEDELEPEAPRVVVVDINKSMLEAGRKRFTADQRVHPSRPHMDWVHASAEQLPFDDCSFDVYTIAFGIRNVTHIEDALREVRSHPSGTCAGLAAPAA